MKRKDPGATFRTSFERAALFVLILMTVGAVSIIVPLFLYQSNYITYDQLNYYAETGLELSFLLSALIYVRFVVPKKSGTAEELGLGRKGATLRNVALGFLVFAIILTLEFIVSLISQVTGVQINTNVSSVLQGAPLWLLFFSAVVFPVCEEVLFRGLMVPRLGIVSSALIFGAMHYSYDSTFGIEMIAAFVFAVIAGYVFRRTKSVYPSIVAHILVNTTTALMTL